MPRRMPLPEPRRSRRRSRTTPSGCLRFDRDFSRLGVGRIQISSGTDDDGEFQRRNAILTLLKEQTALETLRAIQQRRLAIEQVVHAHDRGQLDVLVARWERNAGGGPAGQTRVASVSGHITGQAIAESIVSALAAQGLVSAHPSIGQMPLTTALARLLDGVIATGGAAPAPSQQAVTDAGELLQPAAVMPRSVTSGPPGRSRNGPPVLPPNSPAPGVGAPLGSLAATYAEEEHPLWETLIDRIVPTLECGAQTKRRYRTSLEALRAKAKVYSRDAELETLKLRDLGPTPPREYADEAVRIFRHLATPTARVGDLRAVIKPYWRSLATQWGRSPSDWNHMRRAVSATLTSLFGYSAHPFRQVVVEAIPLANEGGGRVPDLTVETFWQIVDHLPEHARPAPVCLVATGLRLAEYEACRREHLKPGIRAIEVPGSKTASSRSTVSSPSRRTRTDHSSAAIPAPVKRRQLWRYWTEAREAAGVPDVRLHDLRHCLGQWATDEGVQEKSVQWALRHLDPNMTRRYTQTRGKREVAAAMAKVLRR